MDFLGNARPEVIARLGTLWVMNVMRKDIIDEVGGHVSSGRHVDPFAGLVALRESVSPIIFDGNEITVEDFELLNVKCGQ